MKLKEYAEKLQPFVFHGVDCQPVTTGQSTADCPFCQSEGKFGIAVATGQFRCVRCETTGNVYTFLDQYHRLCYERTNLADYQALAQARGLSVIGLRAKGFAMSLLKHEWLIPSYNEKGKLANLYRVFEIPIEDDVPTNGHTNGHPRIRYQPSSTPTCKLQPMGTKTLTPAQKTRYGCEGPWDDVALFDYLRRHTIRAGRYIRIPEPDNLFPNGPISQESLLKAVTIPGSLLETQGCWAMPSAGNFQADWLHLFHEHDNVILADNDHPKQYPPNHPLAGQYQLHNGKLLRPGYNGELRILDLLQDSRNIKPDSTRYIVWGQGDPVPKDGERPPTYINELSTPGHDSNLADGYDVRDAIREHGTSALPFLLSRTVEWTRSSRRKSKPTSERESTGTVRPIPRSSFAEVCADFDERLHYSKPMRETFAIMLAVVISTELPEDPIWLRVIGPPGSGKTTLAECLSVAREWVKPTSILKGFHSGFIDPSDREKDCSLIPEINGKTVIMKDADTLVKSNKRDVIMSELRDIYDGATRNSYLTGRGNDYEDIRITFILCGTDVLRNLSRDTFLGERFLDAEIMDETIDHKPILARAQANAQTAFARFFSPEKPDGDLADHEVHSDDNATFLKQSTYGLIKYFKDNFKQLPCPTFTEVADKRIRAYAQFLSLMRARVERTKNELDYRPRAEVAGRLVKQFTKLAFCLALVLGKRETDQEVMDLCFKVMMDTAKGFQLDITLLLLGHPQGLSVIQLYHELQIAETSVRHWMADMQELKLIHRHVHSNNSGQRGRNIHLWHASELVRELWAACNGLDPSKPLTRKRPSRSRQS